jgi:hypothetical protein
MNFGWLMFHVSSVAKGVVEFSLLKNAADAAFSGNRSVSVTCDAYNFAGRLPKYLSLAFAIQAFGQS